MLNASVLVIDTPRPDAFCPAIEQTRQMVEARQGTVERDGTWRASYVIEHRAAGDFVVLSLRDPKVDLRLTRDIPRQAGDCATTSQVIALVLARFFSSLDAPHDERDESSELKTSTPPNPHPTVDVAQAPHDDRYTSVVAPNQPKENINVGKNWVSVSSPCLHPDSPLVPFVVIRNNYRPIVLMVDVQPKTALSNLGISTPNELL
jgi:hypothetical protein